MRSTSTPSRLRAAAFVAALTLLTATATSIAQVPLASPGFSASQIDAQGRLVEDWGTLAFHLTGTGLSTPPKTEVTALRLDNGIPAAQARQDCGAIQWTLTAFRAPIFPGGVDVVTLTLEATPSQATRAELTLELPPGVRVGHRTASAGGRIVLALPSSPTVSQEMREWGWIDDAASLPGWARPAVDCDPAFRNIRAGLGGVPIHYRFKVQPRAAFSVVLGFCESHWAQSGQRPVIASVEGTPPLQIDPIARWGQHQPGAVTFAAKDDNGDGLLDVSVLPRLGAPDTNPILNVIWLFPPNAALHPEQVVAGKLNALALRYVDVGGTQDQSLHAGGKVQYSVSLPACGRQEFTFLAACPGGSAPIPDRTAWDLPALRRAAADVWRDWPQAAAKP